ncbi:GNAT family N-acetyltransferase [Mucilaginibacter defluvii]|uniref:GNAT family N-acetyltransferase n=1 Tax=Mucilaginibacter defluvii TaxID=1196019 RepID=A0ABP9G0Y9_9SPHI
MILKEYSNDKIMLRQLSIDDANFLYDIYSHPQLTANFEESPFLPDETPTAFTERIVSLCACIFTIRLSHKSHRIIGDCALHHWNKETKEIVIGGSLFPEYWGKGIMRSAFEILTNIAKEEFSVQILLGPTKTRNVKAIRLVEKMGFKKYKVDENDTVMRKFLL